MLRACSARSCRRSATDNPDIDQEPETPCAIWQYAETGRADGVPNAIDTDVFYGDAAALAAHCF